MDGRERKAACSAQVREYFATRCVFELECILSAMSRIAGVLESKITQKRKPTSIYRLVSSEKLVTRVVMKG